MRTTIRSKQLANQRPDTRADIDHRIATRAAGEQAVQERKAKFPMLTATNAEEALAWQEARLRELMAPINARWYASNKVRR